LLTIMCTSTRFPEAKSTLIKFFTLFGLPQAIQSDQGSNFMSGLFWQVMYQLGIQQFKSSAYHPQSQGALEHFHQTLKNMLRKYCPEEEKEWDEGVHLVLFSARESIQESLGFSPFELVFGRTVRGPLKLLKEHWLVKDTELNLLDYVSDLWTETSTAYKLAQKNLTAAQGRMKVWYHRKPHKCSFNLGDKVLVLLPIPGHPLQAQTLCDRRESKYIVQTPERRKRKQLCHINMLKAYYEKCPPQTSVRQHTSKPLGYLC